MITRRSSGSSGTASRSGLAALHCSDLALARL